MISAYISTPRGIPLRRSIARNTEVSSMRPKVSSWLVLSVCLAALAATILFRIF
jgi:hypothetical protein